MFRADVIAQLQYYVYRLVDPRTGRTFYVGKGTGNRVFSHATGSPDTAATDGMSLKLETITAIRAAGLDVEHHIHRHGLDESTAFHVEAALIDAYEELANLVRGHGASARGSQPTHAIVARYQAPVAKWLDRMLLVGIRRTAGQRSNYDAARYAWPLDRRKLSSLAYVLAIRDRLIVDAFMPTVWMDATRENFPDADHPLPGRSGFEGIRASSDIIERYVGKRLPDDCVLSQTGIRYVGPAIKDE